MRKNEKTSGIMQKILPYRNTIFMSMCLSVHLMFVIVFSVMRAFPLVALNSVSVLFYMFCLIIVKAHSEKAIVYTYYEIIAFALVSELFTQGMYGFIYYVLGMTSVVFYLAPSMGNNRFRYQSIGIFAAIAIFAEDRIMPMGMFTEPYGITLTHGKLFTFINLVITLFTILYSSFFYDLELSAAKKELAYNSTHDTLTGLYNRRFLYDTVRNSTAEKITLVMFDIDHFKKINDRFGHDEGDNILRRVSTMIIAEAKDNEAYPVRWGGEEFMLCFENRTSDEVYECVNRLHRRISEETVLPDGENVTVTAGISSGEKSQFEIIAKKSDEYLYKGKNGGRNCIVWSGNDGEYA